VAPSKLIASGWVDICASGSGGWISVDADRSDATYILGSGCARWHGSGVQYTTTAVDHWLGIIQGQRPSSEKDHPKHVPPGVPLTLRRNEIRLFPNCCAQTENTYRRCVHGPMQWVYVTSLIEICQRSIFSSP